MIPIMFFKDRSIVSKKDFKLGTFFIEEEEYPLLHEYLQNPEAMKEFSKFKDDLEVKRLGRNAN